MVPTICTQAGKLFLFFFLLLLLVFSFFWLAQSTQTQPKPEKNFGDWVFLGKVSMQAGEVEQIEVNFSKKS